MEQRLKKADLFISDFVPTEYTGYIPYKKTPFKRHKLQKRALLVEPEDANRIMANEDLKKQNEQNEQSTTTTTQAPRLSSTTSAAPSTSSPAATTSSTTSTTTATEKSLEDYLKEKLKDLDAHSSVDPHLIKMLNETLSSGSKEEMLSLMMSVVKKLQSQVETSTSSSSTTSIPNSENEIETMMKPKTKCSNIEGYKILPEDDMQTVRLKQGTAYY